MAAGQISIKNNLRGPNYVTVSAMHRQPMQSLIPSILFALEKQMLLYWQFGACVNEMGMGGFNALRALSTRNETPETASRPFDAERDGCSR